MPTICSACGQTAGKCEGCRKVDLAINQHENKDMRQYLRSMTGAAIVLSTAVQKQKVSPNDTGAKEGGENTAFSRSD